MALNKTILQGNLIRDPELRQVGEDSQVCRMVLAVDRPGRKKKNDDQPPQCFEIEAWDQKAALCAEHLHKGRAVIIEGRLQQDRWTDRNSGESRTKVIVKADNIEFISDRRKSDADIVPEACTAEAIPAPPDSPDAEDEFADCDFSNPYMPSREFLRKHDIRPKDRKRGGTESR